MEYILRSSLVHATFELLNACEDHRDTLPDDVLRALDAVQRELYGGFRFVGETET